MIGEIDSKVEERKEKVKIERKIKIELVKSNKRNKRRMF